MKQVKIEYNNVKENDNHNQNNKLSEDVVEHTNLNNENLEPFRPVSYADIRGSIVEESVFSKLVPKFLPKIGRNLSSKVSPSLKAITEEDSSSDNEKNVSENNLSNSNKRLKRDVSYSPNSNSFEGIDEVESEV